jgi:IS4 transposase
VSELPDFMDKKSIDQLAREAKFVQRKSPLDGSVFLNTLMFSSHQGNDLSLRDIGADMMFDNGVSITKQSIDGRFNQYAVDFLTEVLSKTMENQLAGSISNQLTNFKRIRVKDSTRFALPSSYKEKYTGHGGATHNSESMISIQYEYDLLSGDAMDLRLTSGVDNDQKDARDNTHDIQEKDLFLRDLGYATIPFLKQIQAHNAYYLNRVSPQTKIYHAHNPEREIDLAACQKKIKKHNLPYLEYEVFLGKKAKLPCRLIIHPVDQSSYDNRMRKVAKQSKSCGHKVSEEYKTRAWLTLYITNGDKKDLPTAIIKRIYRLRWQIELIFKVWKSQGRIAQVKEMKLHRFECQLLAKLIWLIYHMRLYNYLALIVSKKYSEKTVSIWKYYKCAYVTNHLTRKIIYSPNNVASLLELFILAAKNLLLLERKRGKPTHYESLLCLA